MKDEATTQITFTKASAGKYLTFRLANEEYGLPILNVREIIGLMTITPVPRVPHYIRGVINLRGKIIPVVDLRHKFGMEAGSDTEQTCIIVVETSVSSEVNMEMGILVDAVSEVLDIPEQDIQSTPTFGPDVRTDFILGLAKAKGSVKILLNLEQTLSQTDVADALSALATAKEDAAAL